MGDLLRVNQRPSPLREWLGFAGWISVLCILAYGATVFWDRLNYEEAPAEPVPKTIVAPTRSKVESVTGANAALARNSYRPSATPHTRDPIYPFYTIEPDGRNGSYRRVGFSGQECINPYLDRGIILSEDQSGYPVPESACGPTAILDWLIWYQNSGLVPRSTQHADLATYKRITFDLIDRRIAALKGHARTHSGGTDSTEIMVVFDELVRDLSRGKIRLSCNQTDAPLVLRDLLNQTQSYRAGILIVQVHDPKAPPPGAFHAVALLRTDATGRISIANWGEYKHGRLVQKPDGQWFVAEDGSSLPMKVHALLTFIPFRPTAAN